MKTMKRLLFMAGIALLPAMAASQAVIAFETKTHDFGTINEADGRVSYDFVFENQGNAPLVISRVQASCGCTTPSWTKSPVEPGQKGTITVSFNPAGRPGNFNKGISVQSNASETRERLVIKGTVVPRERGEARAVYRVAMDNIRLTGKDIAFGTTNKGIVGEATLKIKNVSSDPVRFSFAGMPSYVSTDAPESTLAANEEKEVTFTFNSEQCPTWGPVEDYIYVVVNGRETRSDTYKLTLRAKVEEDFSNLTLEEKRSAPILEMPQRAAHLGRVTAGKHQVTLDIKNAGQNPLEIRRIISNDKEIVLKQERMTIKGGRSDQLKFTVELTDLTAGNYNRTITLQTNDPENAYVAVSVSWEVK